MSFYWASRSEWLLYCQSGPRRGLFIYEGVWHIWYWQQWPQLGWWWVPGVTNCIATTSNISLQSQHLLANQGRNFYFARVRKPNKESGSKSVFSFSTLIPGYKTQRDKINCCCNKKNICYKDIKVGWRQSSASKWLAGRIHSLPPSSLGRGQETIEMCETQLGLYMIMDPDVFSSHYYQRPVITQSNDKFACHWWWEVLEDKTWWYDWGVTQILSWLNGPSEKCRGGRNKIYNSRIIPGAFRIFPCSGRCHCMHLPSLSGAWSKCFSTRQAY